jgi:hypothetical protein
MRACLWRDPIPRAVSDETREEKRAARRRECRDRSLRGPSVFIGARPIERLHRLIVAAATAEKHQPHEPEPKDA